MPDTPLEIRSPLQRLLVERALALAQELEAAADAAPFGQILDRIETFLLDHGRDFLRHAAQATAQAHLQQAEKKGLPPAPVPGAISASVVAPANAPSSRRSDV